MNHRLLLVEDNHIHLLLTEEFFERQGYSVVGLEDGLQFLQTVDTFQPDLILMDLKLPYVDGFTLIEQLRQTSQKHIPVVVVSAYAFMPERDRALRLGVARYLVKPTALTAIAEAVHEELLKARHSL